MSRLSVTGFFLKISLLILGILPSQAADLRLSNLSGEAVDWSEVQRVGTEAIAAFEQIFGALPQDIHVQYGGLNCLRVGYQFTEKVVRFCKSERVLNAGMNSADVIRHEIFHAMFCQVQPDTCTAKALRSVETQTLHEALADLFAYTLAPDASFGEDFYLGQASVRNYATSSCYSLIDSSAVHERGNAVVSALLVKQMQWPEIKSKILASTEFKPQILWTGQKQKNLCLEDSRPVEIQLSVQNHPASKQRRFRLQSGAQPLILKFTPNAPATEQYKDIRVVWSEAKKMQIESQASDLEFSIRYLDNKGYEKIYADFYSGNEWIGRWPFYIGAAVEKQ